MRFFVSLERQVMQYRRLGGERTRANIKAYNIRSALYNIAYS